MTENATPATEPAAEEAPTAAPEIAADAPEATPESGGEHPDDVKWRQRYRQAEVALTVESARVSELNRREAERLAAVYLEDASDMWLDGTAPADVLGGDGLVDPDLVEAQARRVIEAHPHWKRAKPVTGAPAAAVTSDGKIGGGPQAPTWADLLGGAAG